MVGCKVVIVVNLNDIITLSLVPYRPKLKKRPHHFNDNLHIVNIFILRTTI